MVRTAESELFPQTVRRPGTQLVEDVVVPLLPSLAHDPGRLQQIVGDVAAHHRHPVTEVDLDELAKAGRVVVAGGFGVAEGFQDWVSCGAGRDVLVRQHVNERLLKRYSLMIVEIKTTPSTNKNEHSVARTQ